MGLNVTPGLSRGHRLWGGRAGISLANRLTFTSGGDAPQSDPIIQSIDASGWTITANTTPPTMQPDTAPRYLYVTRSGYDGSASVVTFIDQLILTTRLRLPVPDQNTWTPFGVVLSDYVYSTDVPVGAITNNSTEISPKPVANWVLVDRQTVGNTISQAVVAAHRDGRNGLPVACVVFRATDGTNTVTQTVSTPAILGLAGDKNPIIGYPMSLDVSSLANGQITVNAKVYPIVGGTASVLDSADQSLENQFSPRIYTKSASGPLYIYVVTGGNDSTGVLSTNPVTAKATPCATLAGAFSRARAQNGTVMDNVTIRLSTGTWELTVNNPSGTYNTNSECIIERDPDVLFTDVTYRFGGNFDTRLKWGRWRNLQLARTAGSTGIKSDRAVLENCTLNNNNVSAAIASTSVYILGLTVTGGTASLFAPGATAETRLARGLSGSGMNIEDRVIVGCSTTASGPVGSSVRGQNGCFVGFSTFYAIGSISPFWVVAATADVTGYANIQNIGGEWTSSSNNAAMRVSGDSATGNVTHYIEWHSTVPGYGFLGRCNDLYNETSATLRTHKLCSFVGPLWTQINTKQDIFAYNNSLPNSSLRVGGWPFMLGVGCRGEFSMFSANAPDSEAQQYPGLNASIGTSTTVRNDPLFVSYQAVTAGPTPGTGNGNYQLQVGSPAIARTPRSPLPYDLAGTPRTTAASASGAYEGPGGDPGVPDPPPDPGPSDFSFGALTRAGAGGVSAPDGATAITGGTATGYALTGGYVAPSGNGSATTGTIVFDNGTSWTVAAVASSYSVRQWSECAALLSLGAALSGATVLMRFGSYDNLSHNFYGSQLRYASTVTWRGIDPANKPIVSKWQFAGPAGTALGNVVFQNIDIFYPSPTVGLPYNTINVNIVSLSGDTRDVTVQDCRIRSDMLPYYQGGRLIANIAAVNALEGSQNIKIKGCSISNMVVGIYMAANGFEISGNSIDLDWGDSWVFQSGANNGLVENNHRSGAHGDQAFLHCDGFQLQPTTNSAISNIVIQGNTLGTGGTWLTQGAAVGNVGVQIITITSSRALTDDDTGKEVRINATTGPIVLTLPAATVGKQFVFRRMDSTANTVTFVPNGLDTLSQAPVFNTTGQAYAIIVFNDGVWDPLPQGFRPQTLIRRASFVAGALETGKIIYAEALSGMLTITLPPVGSGSYDFVIRKDDTTSNLIHIVKPDGTFSTGQTSIDLNRIGLTKRFQNSGSVWTVTEYGPGTQGVFSNAHPTLAIYNITVRGNILWVLDPHGVKIEQAVDGFAVYNNTILRPFPADIDGDGIGAADGWVSAAVGNINAQGTKAFASRNITSGQLLLTGGATGTNNIILNLSDPTNLAPMTAVFTGTDAADFRPVTRDQVVAAAQITSPGSLIGATEFWDFTTGQQKTVTTPPSLLDISPSSGSTNVDPSAPIIMTFDQPMARGTGTLVLRNITDGIDVETFDAASSSQILIVGEAVTVTPSSPMTVGKNYGFTVPNGGFKSVYNVNYSGLSGYSFTIAAPAVFNKVTFGGAANLRINADVVNSTQTVTFGVRFKPNTTTTGQDIMAFSTQGTFLVASIAAPNWRITTKDASLVENCRINTTTGPLTTDTPKTLLVAIDLSSSPAKALCYLDGVSIGSVATLVQGSTINLDRATAGISIGSNVAGSAGLLSADVEFVWFDDHFVDISLSGNRAKFTAAQIGSDGSGPTGSKPLVYVTGAASVWNAGTNQGTVGNFTVTGAVT